MREKGTFVEMDLERKVGCCGFAGIMRCEDEENSVWLFEINRSGCVRLISRPTKMSDDYFEYEQRLLGAILSAAKKGKRDVVFDSDYEVFSHELKNRGYKDYPCNMERWLTRVDIINITSTITEIPVDKIMGKSRHRELSEARFIAMYFMMDMFKDTFVFIGRYFGRHHSTVMHTIETVKDLISQKGLFRDKFMAVEKRIEQVERNQNCSRINCDVLIGNITM